MKRLWWGAAILGLAAVTAVFASRWPYLTLAAPARFRDYVYREITYALIAGRVAAQRGRSAEARAKRLSSYVHDTVFSDVQSGIEESFFLDNLVTGTGLCYHHALGLVILGSYSGLDGRTRMMGHDQMDITHVVAELRIGGQWKYFDPFFGLVFTRVPSGEVATAEEIAGGQAVSEKLEGWAAYSPLRHQQYLHLQPLGTWSLGEHEGWVRRLMRLWVRLSTSVPEKWYAYQDAYLERWEPDARSAGFLGPEAMQDEHFREFYRARNLHLWGRAAEARKRYTQLVQTRHDWTDDTLYFLGQSYRKSGECESAIQTFERLLTDDPQSFWRDAATYWMGWCHQQLGHEEQAQALYRQVPTSDSLDVTVRLMGNGTSPNL